MKLYNSKSALKNLSNKLLLVYLSVLIVIVIPNQMVQKTSADQY